tara:strand:+ start:835 stop:1416 length:582 start_codon:yes stop_codon:yes gene_type:complete
MKIYLLRHTSLNIPTDTFYGQSNVDVSFNFMNEVNDIKIKLKKENIDLNNTMSFSSPLKRCTKLANQVCENYRIDERLKELYFGDWELKPFRKISRKEVQKWQENLMTYKIPNGESNLEFYSRLESFCRDIILNCKSDIFIVAHAGSINCILSCLSKIPFDKLVKENWKKIGYGSLTLIKKKHSKFAIEFIGR